MSGISIPLQPRAGTGTLDPFIIVTFGEERWLCDGLTGAIVAKIENHSEPTTPGSLPAFFFRSSGGKQQFCVKFASGSLQILATEP